jgi:hypothetical protein
MGLVFEGITGEQRSMIAKWLCGESTASSSGLSALPRHQEEAAEGKGQLPESARFLKLLNILTRKGILSESEARSLLRDL